ncbi:MAG: glycosyltransferase [Patescibacteria group bacterium]|nr:glycosyltransferase [Patescibacteria group bacterium]
MTFSIIVVVSRGVENKDRRAVFAECFATLCRQDFPKENFEIVIVDSGSGLNNGDIDHLSRLASQSDANFTLLKPNLGNLGAARGRNFGLRAVNRGQTKILSSVLVFTDDDVAVPPNWLIEFDRAFKDNPDAVGAGGLTLPPPDLVSKNIFAAYERSVYENYPKAQRCSFSINEHPVFGGNIAYRRDILNEVGGFDERFVPSIYGEDADLKERVVSRGYFLVFLPIINRHLSSYNFRRFLAQNLSLGGSILQFKLNHGQTSPGYIWLTAGLLTSPVIFLLNLARGRERGRVAFLDGLANFFRQLGKIKYRAQVIECFSSQMESKTRRIRILFADHTPFVGGAQLALLRHLKFLDRQKFWPVMVLSGSTPDLTRRFEEVFGLTVKILRFPRLKSLQPQASLYFLADFLDLISLVNREGIEILTANTERAYYLCFLVSLVLRKKLILILRDFEYSRILLRLTAFKVGRYVCVSKSVQDFYGLEKRATVVYVGSDFEKRLSQVSDLDIDIAAVSLGLPNTRGILTIGFVGRLVFWKGPFLLLDAFTSLVKEGREARLVFVGEGVERERLAAKVSQSGLSDRVFFTGFCEEPAVWYKIFDIFVQASIEPEPFATAVIEAGLAGLPIAATNTGGTKEFVEDGVTGLLVTPSADSLTNALEKLANNESLRERLGKNALKKALNSFGEEKITGELMEIYSSV